MAGKTSELPFARKIMARGGQKREARQEPDRNTYGGRVWIGSKGRSPYYWMVMLTVFELIPPALTTTGTLPVPASDCGITTLI
jgi:hypothetical protein